MATFLPGVGMTGHRCAFSRVAGSLHFPGRAQFRSSRTGRLPFVAPWANRLAGRVAIAQQGVDVDLTGLALGTDDNGLPIRCLQVGASGWHVDRTD